MPTSFRYHCQSCGEHHTGLPAWHFAAPVQVQGIPADERAARVDLTDDGCTIDGREFYVKGLLEIPVRETTHTFTWGVWLSLSEVSFERYCVLFEDQRRSAGESFFGWLCNSVPGYPDRQLLKARLHVRKYPHRPSIDLEPTDHPLSVDQNQGISEQRAAELAAQLVHGNPAQP